MVQTGIIEEFQRLTLAERLRLINYLLQLVLAEVMDEEVPESSPPAGSEDEVAPESSPVADAFPRYYGESPLLQVVAYVKATGETPPDVERSGWTAVSEQAFQRIWDNEEDAIYDNWREIYGIPEG